MFFYLSFLVQELLNILHILAFIAFEDACVWDSDLFVLWFVFVNLILCMAQWTGVHSQAYQVRISHPTSQSSPLPYTFFLKHTSLTRFILLEENFQSKMNNLLMGFFFLPIFDKAWSVVLGEWKNYIWLSLIVGTCCHDFWAVGKDTKNCMMLIKALGTTFMVRLHSRWAESSHCYFQGQGRGKRTEKEWYVPVKDQILDVWWWFLEVSRRIELIGIYIYIQVAEQIIPVRSYEEIKLSCCGFGWYSTRTVPTAWL